MRHSLPRPQTHLGGARHDHISSHGIAGGRLGAPHRHAALGARHGQADRQLATRLVLRLRAFGLVGRLLMILQSLAPVLQPGWHPNLCS